MNEFLQYTGAFALFVLIIGMVALIVQHHLMIVKMGRELILTRDTYSQAADQFVYRKNSKLWLRADKG